MLNLFLFFLALPPAAFSAEDCLEACHRLPVRMAELRCNLECERRDPAKYRKYCPGFTPCMIDCEARIPAESMPDQASKEAKTKCNGVCFTRFFKIDCSDANYHPPGEDGPGNRDKPLGGQGAGADIALSNDGLLGGMKAAAGPQGTPAGGRALPNADPGSTGVSAAIAGAEAATAKTLAAAEAVKPKVPSGIAAEIGDHRKKEENEAPAGPAEEHLWHLEGGMKPQHFASKPIEGASALADVVKASIGEAGELSLFQRVTRAYRNTRQWGEAR